MTAKELQFLVFELLHKELVEGQEHPTAFVGVQGDHVVVIQPNDEHFGIAVVRAKATVQG